MASSVSYKESILILINSLKSSLKDNPKIQKLLQNYYDKIKKVTLVSDLLNEIYNLEDFLNEIKNEIILKDNQAKIIDDIFDISKKIESDYHKEKRKNNSEKSFKREVNLEQHINNRLTEPEVIEKFGEKPKSLKFFNTMQEDVISTISQSDKLMEDVISRTNNESVKKSLIESRQKILSLVELWKKGGIFKPEDVEAVIKEYQKFTKKSPFNLKEFSSIMSELQSAQEEYYENNEKRMIGLKGTFLRLSAEDKILSRKGFRNIGLTGAGFLAHTIGFMSEGLLWNVLGESLLKQRNKAGPATKLKKVENNTNEEHEPYQSEDNRTQEISERNEQQKDYQNKQNKNEEKQIEILNFIDKDLKEIKLCNCSKKNEEKKEKAEKKEKEKETNEENKTPIKKAAELIGLPNIAKIGILGKISSFFEILSPFFKQIGKKLSELKFVQTFLKSEGILGKLLTVLKFTGKFLFKLGTAFGWLKLGADLITGFVEGFKKGGILEGVFDAVKRGLLGNYNVKTVKGRLINAATNAMKGMAIGSLIGGPIGAVIGASIGGILGFIAPEVNKALNFLKNGIVFLFKNGFKIIKGAFNIVKDTFKFIFDYIILGPIKLYINLLKFEFNMAKKAFSFVTNFIVKAGKFIIDNLIIKPINNFFNIIKAGFNIIKSVGTSFFNFIKSSIDFLKNGFLKIQKTFKEAGEFVSNMFNFIVDKISNTVTTFLHQIIEKILHPINKAYNWILEKLGLKKEEPKPNPPQKPAPAQVNKQGQIETTKKEYNNAKTEKEKNNQTAPNIINNVTNNNSTQQQSGTGHGQVGYDDTIMGFSAMYSMV